MDALGTAHSCPPGRGLIPYYAVFIEFDTISVLVKRVNSVTSFPEIHSGEIPHRGQHMSQCFSSQLESIIGTKYELVFLYSTINDTYQRHLPSRHFALFACEEPIDPTAHRLIPPARPEYRWVPINQYYEDDDVIFKGMAAPYVYAWSLARRSFAGEINEHAVRPWETSSWLWRTTRNVNAVLKDLGYTVTGPYEQHQISSTAAVLRIPTKRGRLYLKASHRREGLTMKIAAEFAPFLVPSPLYVNVEDELMIMNDYGPTLADTFSKEDYNRVIKLHGMLQLASIGYVRELAEIGIPQVDFESLKARAKQLLEDPEVDESLRKVSGLAEIEPYRDSLYLVLQKLYLDLDLPRTIVHGDVYDENIIRVEQDDMLYVLYDWGCARIDIPFTDVINLESEVCDYNRSTLSMDPYLALWAQYGTIKHLKVVCSALSRKDEILSILESYEYARRKHVHPPLSDEDARHLWNTLNLIRETQLLKNHEAQDSCANEA